MSPLRHSMDRRWGLRAAHAHVSKATRRAELAKVTGPSKTACALSQCAGRWAQFTLTASEPSRYARGLTSSSRRNATVTRTHQSWHGTVVDRQERKGSSPTMRAVQRSCRERSFDDAIDRADLRSTRKRSFAASPRGSAQSGASEQASGELLASSSSGAPTTSSTWPGIDWGRGRSNVLWTGDNGAWQDVYPDAGYTPFRGTKGIVREGGNRVPSIAWGPGIKPASRN